MLSPIWPRSRIIQGDSCYSIVEKYIPGQNVLKNYRKVTNLQFVSKVLERAVAKQLQTYLNVNNLNEAQQSAYRKHLSKETTLLSVQNDIVQAMNGKKSVILVLPDLSAAFDTIDHTALLH